MSESGTLVILYSGSLDNDRPDELDTIAQMHAISKLARELGYHVESVPYHLGEEELSMLLPGLDPLVVVNLVESVDGSDAHIYQATRLLDRLGLAYTGAPTDCLLATASKTLLKRQLEHDAIPTPVWAGTPLQAASLPPGRYIVKSATEHGSLGIDPSSIVHESEVAATMRRLSAKFDGEWFAEAFVEGREFNIAMIAGPNGPQVLPHAEISFAGLPESAPHIMDYAAKWREGTDAYEGVLRVYPDPNGPDAPLLARLTELALASWHCCGMRGYGRVDFRVDAEGNPWVIDINLNPSLDPDVATMAAAAEAGISPAQVLQRIIDDALKSPALAAVG